MQSTNVPKLVLNTRPILLMEIGDTQLYCRSTGGLENSLVFSKKTGRDMTNQTAAYKAQKQNIEVLLDYFQKYRISKVYRDRKLPLRWGSSVRGVPRFDMSGPNE